MTSPTVPRTVLLERVSALADRFSSRAREAERRGALPDDLVAEAKAAGVYTLYLPAALGGLEVEVTTLVEVVEELSRGDASAGWCAGIGNATSFFAWLDPGIAAELLAGHTDIS